MPDVFVRTQTDKLVGYTEHRRKVVAEEGTNEQELELKLDAENMYREETFTDRKIGTLRRLTPVTKDGADDPSRSVMFVGQAQLWTQMGPLPINFELDSPNLEEALKAFQDAALIALEHTMEEAREARRQQDSQIVVPGQSPGGIQMP
jgi:hypothetical protein